MGNLSIETGLNEYIAREEQFLLDHTLAIAELGILLSRKQNLSYAVSQRRIISHQCLQVLLYLCFFTAYGFQYVPLLTSLSHC